MALPIVLNSLNLQTLTPSSARTEAKRSQLRLLNEAMGLCHKRYIGTLSAKSVINRTIKAACSDHYLSEGQVTKSTAVISVNPTTKNWFDVFVSKPTQYLRIARTIVVSFSMGCYPDTEDYLPQQLSLQERTLSSQMALPALPTATSNTTFETTLHDKTLRTESSTNLQLDYLDLNGSESCRVSMD